MKPKSLLALLIFFTCNLYAQEKNYIEQEVFIPTNSVTIHGTLINPILKGKKIFVMENGKAKEVIIKTGLRTDTQVAVEEGLMVGDSVASVTPSFRRLRDFRSIELGPGERRQVQFSIPVRDLRFVGKDMEYVLEKGWMNATVQSFNLPFRWEP